MPVFVGAGSSMVPAVFPRDRLVVRLATPTDLRAGAIVVFPGPDRVVAHRILRVESAASGEKNLIVRGDSQQADEQVPISAVVYIVVEVRGRFGTWLPEGLRGRLLARMALAESGGFALAKTLVRLALRGALTVRKARAREPL